MQLYNDQNPHINRSHSPLPVGKAGSHFKPRTLSIRDEESLHEAPNPKCVLRHRNYSICLADSPGRCHLVNKLIKCMYSWRGYHTENAVLSSHNPNRLTLEASIEQQIVGTLTVGLDSEEGLLVDTLYEQEIKAFRSNDRKVSELSKLAIDPQHSSKELLASLFNLAYIYARIVHKVTYFVIEVNPRHAGYYKRMLGFRQIGEKRVCPRVNAPAVLLHLELDYVDEQVASLAGSLEPAKERSLYAYFLTKHEEEKVAHSLRRYIN